MFFLSDIWNIRMFLKVNFMCVFTVCVHVCAYKAGHEGHKEEVLAASRNTWFASCRSPSPSFPSPSSIYSCLWPWWKTHAVCPVFLYLCGWACVVYAREWNAEIKVGWFFYIYLYQNVLYRPPAHRMTFKLGKHL